jgi:5,10-methylenetetrahydromethanopterin reductase
LDGIGLALDVRWPIRTLVSAANAAEQRGFSGAWAVHYFYYRDPFVVLAAVASKTSKISLGTAVTNVYERHPLAVAMATASIHEMSNERMILGLGVSVPYPLSTEMGIPYHAPQQALKEAVKIIRDYFSGKVVQFEGKHFRIKGAKLGCGPSVSAIPIYLAAVGPKALALAGEIADGVILNYGTNPAYVSHALAEIGGHRRSLAGFDVCSLIWVTPEETAESLKLAKQTLADFFATPRFAENIIPYTHERLELLTEVRKFYYPTEGRYDLQSASELISDKLVKSLIIVGEKGSRARLEEYRNAGVKHPIIVPLGGEDKLQQAIEIYAPRS